MKNRLDILKKVYGECEWSESALIPLLRVMQLTREDEQLRQMKLLEEHKVMVIETIINILKIQHEAACGRHNYWLCAAELIKAECLEDET